MAQLSPRPNQVVDLTGDDSDIELDETSVSPFAMAQLSPRPNQVVDLTGDDSDIELDETSVSPFAKALMKQFNARSSPASKPRTLVNERHLEAPPAAIGASSTHVDLTIAGSSTTSDNRSRSVSKSVVRNPPAADLGSAPPLDSGKLPLEINSNGHESSTNASTSFTLHGWTPSLQPGINGSSHAVSISTITPAQVGSRKRNAEQAFRDERRSSISPNILAGPAVSISRSNITKFATEKQDNGRAGFGALLSAAEASVTGAQPSESNFSGAFTVPSSLRNSLVPTGRQSTPSNAAESLRHSFQSSQIVSPLEQDTSSSTSRSSPKAFAPPPLQQASFGAPLRIMPIDGSVQQTSTPSLSQSQPTQTKATSWQSQYTSTTSIEAKHPVPSRPVNTLATDYPPQVLHASGHNQYSQDLVGPRFGHEAFESSILPTRQGTPFTQAELVLLIYLKEECNVGWTDLDRKMGRTTNCCATKYLRKTNGVKYRKSELKYRERAAMIKVILRTVPGATVEKVWRLLSDFVELGSMPPGCSALYTEILGASSVDVMPDTPRKIRISELPKQSALDSVFGSNIDVPAPVRKRLRPGARTGEDAMNVKAMMAREINAENEVLSDEASVHTGSAFDSSSDVECHALARKEYPEGVSVRRKKPYLGFKERREMRSTLRTVKWVEDEDWRGLSIHLDPSENELEALRQCTVSVLKNSIGGTTSLAAAVKAASQAQKVEVARRAQLLPQLRGRTQKSIHSMLLDASKGKLNHAPLRLRMAPVQSLPSDKQISTRLLRRELGGAKTACRNIRRTVYDSLAPSRSWTGTSGDVGTLAWSPDGQHFAAGSMCIVDASSMQYNRQNNLLLGNKQYSSLYELPEHHRPREKPKEGANASHSMHVSQDPRLFFTVSMVDFSKDGSHMFSVGYDKFLRSYKVRDGRCEQRWAVDHGTEVDLLSTSRRLDLLATGSRDIRSGIRVFGTHGEREELARFSSGKAQTFWGSKVLPSALRWGAHSFVRNYLLAGFSPTSDDEPHVTTHGETCLWDVSRQAPVSVTPAAGNIFDVAWSPVSARFATACSAYSHHKSRGTRSVIRICSPVSNDSWNHRGLELECPARDINDVIFCPFDENYVAAGATNSKVYIWDLRKPDKLLQRFSHGAPLAELEPGRAQEDTDCGVRFCGWGESRDRLLTGSSDGVVKLWDIHRAPRDAHIRDIATFDTGIMSGAFNHDFSGLLIGEVNGTVNLLEVGVDPPRHLKDLEHFRFVPSPMENHNDADAPIIEEESGRVIGAALIKKGKIQRRNMGGFPRRQAVQAKSYDGPIDHASDANDLRAKALLFQKSMMLEVYDASGKLVRDGNNRAVYRDQCKLHLCTSRSFTTEEEAGDSGRAVDRVPQALREATSRTLGRDETKAGKMVPGMLRCSHCHGLARPRIGDREQEEFPLCERCGFSCFRCGGRVKVGLGVESIGCGSCGLEWRVGALGYEVINPSGDGREARKFKSVTRQLDTPPEHEANGDGLEDLGDLLHLVEDYYQDLWRDRPSSPG